MNRLFSNSLLAAAALLLAAGASASDIKLGFVNLKKVFDKYYKTIECTAAIKAEAVQYEKERTQMIESLNRSKADWQKLLDKANDQAVSQEERDRSKKAAEDKYNEMRSANDAIAEFSKVSESKLMEKERQRRDAIVGEITNVVYAKAQAHGYSAVLDVSGESANIAPVVLYYNGENEITDEVLKELNAAAPPQDVTNLNPQAIKSIGK